MWFTLLIFHRDRILWNYHNFTEDFFFEVEYKKNLKNENNKNSNNKCWNEPLKNYGKGWNLIYYYDFLWQKKIFNSFFFCFCEEYFLRYFFSAPKNKEERKVTWQVTYFMLTWKYVCNLKKKLYGFVSNEKFKIH